MDTSTHGYLPDDWPTVWMTVADPSQFRVHDTHDLWFLCFIVKSQKGTGVSLFARLEVGFLLGGFAFVVGFPNGFCPLLCASTFCLWETWSKKWWANERPKISQENVNTFFSSGNQNAKAGYERNNRKTPKLYCFSITLVLQISDTTKCKGPHHDLDDFTTDDFTTFTTSRLVIDLETGFTVQNWVSRSITSLKVVKVVKP